MHQLFHVATAPSLPYCIQTTVLTVDVKVYIDNNKDPLRLANRNNKTERI